MDKEKELLEAIAKLLDSYEFPNKEDLTDGENIECLIRFDFKEEYIYTGGEFELKSQLNSCHYPNKVE